MAVINNIGITYGPTGVIIYGSDGKPKNLGGGGGGGTNSNVLIDGGTFLVPTQYVLIDAGIF